MWPHRPYGSVEHGPICIDPLVGRMLSHTVRGMWPHRPYGSVEHSPISIDPLVGETWSHRPYCFDISLAGTSGAIISVLATVQETQSKAGFT